MGICCCISPMFEWFLIEFVFLLYLKRLPEFDDLHPVHEPHYRINRVKFKPSLPEVGAIRMPVMVILEQFAQQQKVKWRGVF